jgi:UDP-3-O-[3-hydroxymyristoyl] N-acetylglucosamine deacetylase
MFSCRSQQTLRNICHVSGRGYWSGAAISLTFLPAAPCTGIVFRRIDLPGHPTIEVNTSNRRETPLRTRLVNGEVAVDMVEHVLAALYAFQIDNCIIETTGCEMPGLDGSAFAFSCALRQAGIAIQDAPRATHNIARSIRIGDDRQWIMATPSATPGLTLEYRLDYGPNSSIRNATFAAEIDANTFHHQIACARTFITKAEAEQLQSQGLAKHVTNRDLLVFADNGPIDNSLRFSDECARHKLLDLIGDLSLTGIDLSGRIVACRSGHKLNGRMADELIHYSMAAQKDSAAA